MGPPGAVMPTVAVFRPVSSVMMVDAATGLTASAKPVAILAIKKSRRSAEVVEAGMVGFPVKVARCDQYGWSTQRNLPSHAVILKLETAAQTRAGTAFSASTSSSQK